MATVVMNVYKGQRMDVTALIKDADVILDVFRKHSIRFDKKFTSLNGKGPSTITFKGIKAENIHSDITEMIMDLHSRAKTDEIGNVYIKLTSFINQKKTSEEKHIENESSQKSDDVVAEEMATSEGETIVFESNSDDTL